MFTDPTGMSKEGGGDSEGGEGGGSWVSKTWNTVKSWFRGNSGIEKNDNNRQLNFIFGEGENEFLSENEAGYSIPIGTAIGGGSLISEIGASLMSVAPVIAVLAAAVTLPQGDTRKEDEIILYRGVYVDHPDYANALLGKAFPRGGDASPYEHNRGNNNSVYTSWTIYPEVADKFGGRKGPGGVVLTKSFPISKVVPSDDKYKQGEVLVKGPVSGAIVTPATPNPKKIK